MAAIADAVIARRAQDGFADTTVPPQVTAMGYFPSASIAFVSALVQSCPPTKRQTSRPCKS